MALHEFNYEKEATVSIVKSILTDAIKMKASDIHFDPEPNKLIIKFRINGDLIEYTTAPENIKANIITRIKILSGMNITETIIPQIGSINFELSSKTHNMRTTSIPVVDGEKIVVHLSNYAKNFKNLNSLGFTKENIDKIMTMLNEQDGIILITGVNASGKTTSLYAILQELSKKPINIISVENPIKMKLPGVNQVQINSEKGITYNRILKSILLSDPDVISINELIDDETVRTALRSSVSGRLVISTMHTKTAFTTIKSLLNMDVENYLLGSNLNGIISQRLVKKLCPTCREKKPATEYEKQIIKKILNKDIDELYVPNGCEECQDGYTEQIPVVEVVNINDELRQAISNNRNKELIYDIIYSENNSIIKDAFQKVINGDTSFEEAIKIIDVKTDFNDNEKELKDLLLGKTDPNENNDENNEKPNQKEELNQENNNEEEQTTDEEEKIVEVENETEQDENSSKAEDETTEQDGDSEDEAPKINNNEETPSENTDDEKNNKEASSKEENEQNKSKEEKSDDDIINDSELLKRALKLIETQLKDKEASEETNSNEEETTNEEQKEEQTDEQTDEQESDSDEQESTSDEQTDEQESKEEEATDSEPTIEIKEINEEKTEETSKPNEEEQPSEQSTPSSPSIVVDEKDKDVKPIIIAQDSEDDDDDDTSFNYGDSYINNF